MDPIIGLEGLVTAELESDTAASLTYKAVEAVEGLVDVELEDASSNSEPQWADNKEKFRLQHQPKMKLVIELLATSHATLAKFFGHTRVNGVMTKAQKDKAPYRAFGFKADDGADNQDGLWLKKCIPVKRTNGMKYHTKEGEKITVQTVKVEFECIPTIFDEEYQKACNSGDAAMAATWPTWFDAVPSAVARYTVTYAPGVGATGAAPVQAALYTGQMFVTAACTFVNAGKNFLGWSDGAGHTYDEGHAVFMGKANLTLTATWSA